MNRSGTESSWPDRLKMPISPPLVAYSAAVRGRVPRVVLTTAQVRVVSATVPRDVVPSPARLAEPLGHRRDDRHLVAVLEVLPDARQVHAQASMLVLRRGAPSARCRRA